MNNRPIDVQYRGKLFKSKNRQIIIEFLYRFYTPFSFIIWILVALNANTCNNAPVLVIIISILAALLNSYNSYEKWRSNVLLITEAQDPKLSYDTKISIVVSEFIVHLLCTMLSFWWVDDMHECISIRRETVGLTWILLLLLSMILHIIQYKVKNRKIIEIQKNAYKHVQSSSDIA